MGTAVCPAKTSPGPWDAFADIDAFVDEVLAELEAMAKDGARPILSGPKPPLPAAQRIAHLKKGEMAAQAQDLLAGSGWLPEPLRTPGRAVTAAPEAIEAEAEQPPADLGQAEADEPTEDPAKDWRSAAE